MNEKKCIACDIEFVVEVSFEDECNEVIYCPFCSSELPTEEELKEYEKDHYDEDYDD